MKKILSTFLIASLILCSGCNALLLGGVAAGGYVVGKDERSAKRIADDASITGAIKTKLLTNRYVNGFKIDVDTYNAVVTLTGTVNSNFSREQAIGIAKNTRGVGDVTDKLRVDTSAQPVEKQ